MRNPGGLVTNVLWLPGHNTVSSPDAAATKCASLTSGLSTPRSCDFPVSVRSSTKAHWLQSSIITLLVDVCERCGACLFRNNVSPMAFMLLRYSNNGQVIV